MPPVGPWGQGAPSDASVNNTESITRLSPGATTLLSP